MMSEAAIPGDGNFKKKEHEKLEKYSKGWERKKKKWNDKGTLVLAVVVAPSNLCDEWQKNVKMYKKRFRHPIFNFKTFI